MNCFFCGAPARGDLCPTHDARVSHGITELRTRPGMKVDERPTQQYYDRDGRRYRRRPVMGTLD